MSIVTVAIRLVRVLYCTQWYMDISMRGKRAMCYIGVSTRLNPTREIIKKQSRELMRGNLWVSEGTASA